MTVARILGYLVLPVLLSSAALSASQNPTGPGAGAAASTGLIVGVVVDAGTGQPVSGAVVTLGGAAVAFAVGALPPGVDPDSVSPVQRSPRRVLTGADGRFVYRGLAEGSYTITASKGGYLAGAFGRRRPGGPSRMLDLEEGERVGDATLHLWKHASISGSVVDETGEPVVGTSVRSYRRTISGGRWRFVPAGSGTTDDRGIYRLTSLIPGDYFVLAASTQSALPLGAVEAYRRALESNDPLLRQEISRELIRAGGSPNLPGSTSALQVGDAVISLGRSATPPPIVDGRFFVYPTMFYPASPTASNASAIAVGSGEERAGIDIQLKLAPTARVSGVLTGPSGPVANTALHLVAAGSDDLLDELESAGTLSDVNGAFTFHGVPQGHYTLKVLKVPQPPPGPGVTTTIIQSSGGGATVTVGSTMPSGGGVPVLRYSTDPVLWGAIPVAVGEEDVTGIVLSLRSGSNLRGRVEFAGTAERPAADQLPRITLTINIADGRRVSGQLPARAQVDAKGEFTSASIAAGRYLVSVLGVPAGWSLKSVTAGSRDLSDLPFEIAGSDIDGIVVTLTDEPSELTGTIRSSQGAPDPDAAALVFPADTALWTLMVPRRMRLARPDRAGKYSLKDLPPGDYLAVAVPDELTGEWQAPANLETLARVASRVHVSDAGTTTRDLRTMR
jgi:hypothetical protein